MKKIALRIAVLTVTFFAGLTAFALVFLYFNSIPDITPPSSPLVRKETEKPECLETSFPGLSKPIAKIKKGKSEYFPKRILGNDMSPKHSVAGRYSRNLQVMQEKSLLDISDADTEVYRFLWLRSFDHPLFVRIERRREGIRLSTKELDGAGGYDPGKILRSSEIALSRKEFEDFLILLEQANYWELSNQNLDETGFDGAEWILEGVKNGRYHFVERWSPQTGEYREACLFLLKLSGVDPDRLKDDLY